MSDQSDINEGSEVRIDKNRDQATRLYKFLREFTQLRTKTTRSVDQYDQVLWLTDVPHEPECDCAAWHRGREEETSENWLRIEKPKLRNAPPPSEDLKRWLMPAEVNDSANEMPALRAEINVETVVDGENQFENLRLEAHPEIRAAWEQYVEDRWWPWAEEDRRLQKVQRVYTELFSIHQKQQRLGEQYEVVLGIGALSWKLPDGYEVFRHLIAAHSSVTFDSTRGVISVGPAGEGAKPSFEQDMLEPKDRPDPEELRAFEAQLDATGDRLWDPAAIDSILTGWVHAASPKGIYRDSNVTAGQAGDDPIVDLAPALILRKRTERSFVEAFNEIINQLESGHPIPDGVSQFVTISDKQPTEPQEETPETVPRVEEIYFPLESNEEQLRIVERSAGHRGVLVQGPPGTGKSHTIVNLICHLLANGQRVLVTSHAGRALKVLQRYIHERVPEISPLAVVLLGDDRDALQAMEDSVQGITFRHNSWNAVANEAEIRQLQGQLDEARRDEAKTFSDLKAVREQETYKHPKRFDRYEGTLQRIAQQVRKEEQAFEWFRDRPPDDAENLPPSDELQELLRLLRNTKLNEWDSGGWQPIDPTSLISPEGFKAVVDRERTAASKAEAASEHRKHSGYTSLVATSRENRSVLHNGLSVLLKSADEIISHFHDWTETAVKEILGDHDRTWKELHDTTQEYLAEIGDKARWADENPFSIPSTRSVTEFKADAGRLQAHLQDGGGWGFGPISPKVVRETRYLRDEAQLSGRPCDNPETLGDLVTRLDIDDRVQRIKTRWASLHDFKGQTVQTLKAETEDLCEPLKEALELHTRKNDLRKIMTAITGLTEPTWHKIESLRDLQKCVEATLLEEDLQAIEREFFEARTAIVQSIPPTAADLAGSELLQAFDTRNVAGYRSSYEQITANSKRDNHVRRRNTLLEKLKALAPLLASELKETASANHLDKRMSALPDAWNWARCLAWLKRLCDPNSEQQLRLQLDSARDRVRNRIGKLASEKAWRHTFARMKEHERQHLVAWSKAVRSIGKGTGKYAPLHRRNAREHLNECRSAIPAWVMPLYRVAETIKPGQELFDVVIIDEASQSGPEALLLAYLAKKLVVVGDDKQISPTYVINFEDVNRLRDRYISDLPHADAYGVNQSFFDLAEIRYPGRIRLREHFRCMPEIIQFSNNLCYQSEPLIPLRQYGATRLSPVVSTRHVPDGYPRGKVQIVNPPEAQAVVSLILELNEDSAYANKSFGVISLQGHAQAREIENLLLQRLGPEQMERRQLVCGDAYAFQGDERDVMFLSMVAASSDQRRIGTLTGEAAKRRFNVAASRARDQLILFHSATLNDLSPQCLRFSLLEYCLNPKVATEEITGTSIPHLHELARKVDRARVRPPDPFGSWFELDVFLQIAGRGYRVIPQYEMGGYRIDLLVEGMKGRLAVECDGDRWHGMESYEKDTARERMLERCGLRFWRIRGSAFYLDPESALDDLWLTLERHGVYSKGQAPADEGVHEEQAVVTDSTMPSETPPRTRPTNVLPFDRPLVRNVAEPTVPLGRLNATLAITNKNALTDKPYRSWESERLPDPTRAPIDILLPGLTKIVETEGPISSNRLFKLFVKAAGRQRVTVQPRQALRNAVKKAVRKGLLEEEVIKLGTTKEQIMRLKESPRSLSAIRFLKDARRRIG